MPVPRARVFCASLADVFEEWFGRIKDASGEAMYSIGSHLYWQAAGTIDKQRHPGFSEGNSMFHTTIRDMLHRLFQLIDRTPHLDWLLLTKRPQNIVKMWPCPQDPHILGGCYHCQFRQNVWLGTSIACKADLPNIEHLRACHSHSRKMASVLFLSIEPLLEDLGTIDLTGIDWVIIGGESGHNARPMHPDWVRSIIAQCVAAGVPVFFKQWGEWLDAAEVAKRGLHGTHVQYVGDDKRAVRNVGKVAAGREIDGRTWSEFPEVAR
jgi:protein gp37